MIKKFFVTLLATTTLLVSCSSDDDNNKELSVEQRNALDDEAIEQILEDYYFSPVNGKLVKFDTITGNEDDNYTPLKNIAIKDPAGYYYAKRPGVEANGPAIVSNDASKILISYDQKYFVSTDDEAYNRKYGYIDNYSSSINLGDGSAISDPSFYYATISDALAENGVKREHVELSNFVDALKHFNSTETNGRDLYNFQGVIILPSRLAYGRNKMYTGSAITTNHPYRNTSFIFSFELHKVTPRQ